MKTVPRNTRKLDWHPRRTRELRIATRRLPRDVRLTLNDIIDITHEENGPQPADDIKWWSMQCGISMRLFRSHLEHLINTRIVSRRDGLVRTEFDMFSTPENEPKIGNSPMISRPRDSASPSPSLACQEEDRSYLGVTYAHTHARPAPLAEPARPSRQPTGQPLSASAHSAPAR